MPDLYNSYKEQLDSLDTTDRLKIKIQGEKDNNETKWMDLNKASTLETSLFLAGLLKKMYTKESPDE